MLFFTTYQLTDTNKWEVEEVSKMEYYISTGKKTLHNKEYTSDIYDIYVSTANPI